MKRIGLILLITTFFCLLGCAASPDEGISSSPPEITATPEITLSPEPTPSPEPTAQITGGMGPHIALTFTDSEQEFIDAVSAAKQEEHPENILHDMDKITHYYRPDALPAEYTFAGVVVNTNSITYWSNIENSPHAAASIVFTTYARQADYATIHEHYAILNPEHYHSLSLIDDTYVYIVNDQGGIITLRWLQDGDLISMTFPWMGDLASITLEEALQYASVTRVDVK